MNDINRHAIPGIYYTYIVDDERLIRAVDDEQPLHIRVKSYKDITTIKGIMNAYDKIISEYEATVSELSSNAEKYVEKIRNLEASLYIMGRRDLAEYLIRVYEGEDNIKSDIPEDNDDGGTNTKSDIPEDNDEVSPIFSDMHIEQQCVLDDNESSKTIYKTDLTFDSRSCIHICFDECDGLKVDIE